MLIDRMASWKVASPTKDESRTSCHSVCCFARDSENCMAYVYVITNIINGKQYVGTTKYSLKRRLREHYSDSKNDKRKNRPPYKDMNEYGIENFCIEELEECCDNERFEKERHWIQKLNTFSNGYNSTYGGVGKNYFDYENIAKTYANVQNQKKVAELLNCDTHTVRVACRERGIKIISSQDIAKEEHSKRIAMIDKETDTVIKTFDCIEDAFRFLNKQRNGHISAVCKGNRKTAYGYKWKYID